MSYLIDHFKAHDQNRAELSAMLLHPTFQKALTAVIENEKAISKFPDDIDAIVSVRIHAYLTGMEDLPRKLLALTVADRPTAQQPDETWGKEEEARKLREAQLEPANPS